MAGTQTELTLHVLLFFIFLIFLLLCEDGHYEIDGGQSVKKSNQAGRAARNAYSFREWGESVLSSS